MGIVRRVTTQDISWFLDLDRNEQLDLDPPYQRRSVWSPKDRRFFLDTIFRGYPSPSIFLHKQVMDGRTIYYVVDGKQRLETILDFAKDKIAIDKNYGDSRLSGKKWKTIKSDEKLARAFWDYVLPVEFTDIVEDTNLVREVFERLNRNSRRLTEQELRHAKHDGWFITFVETEAESAAWMKLGVVTTARTKRMRDVQFLSELLIVLLKENVGGFDQTEISEFCAGFDDPADLDVPFDEEQIKRLFEDAKAYLLDLEREASVVSRYAQDFTNFYSLWAVVVLNPGGLPTVGEFAEKYSNFMEQVRKYKDESYLSKVVSGDEKPSEPLSLKYYQNSTGASTEQPQREARNEVLRASITQGSFGMMKIPKSLTDLHDTQTKELYVPLQQRVDGIMLNHIDRRWHYESRIKDLESFALKIETGCYDDPAHLEDFFACTIVVDNLNAISKAERLVKTKFRFHDRRPETDAVTSKPSDSFRFDDTRLFVKWKDSPIAPTGLDGLLFEVQIKTFLAHAWGIATHDLTYKTDRKSWPQERIAFQIKAMLEHAEISIQEAQKLAESASLKKTDELSGRISRTIKLLNEFWPDQMLPQDKKRLAENIDNLISHVGIEIESLRKILQEESKLGRGAKTLNLSPYSSIVMSLFNQEFKKMSKYVTGRARDFKVFVPNELELPAALQTEKLKNVILGGNG